MKSVFKVTHTESKPYDRKMKLFIIGKINSMLRVPMILPRDLIVYFR